LKKEQSKAGQSFEPRNTPRKPSFKELHAMMMEIKREIEAKNNLKRRELK